MKFALRSYVVSSDNEKNFEISNREIDRKLISERLKNQETLLNYFLYMKKVIANSKLCLQLDAYNGLGCHYSRKGASESEKQTIQTILYTTLLDALSLKNTMFFSSAGSPVLLENFDELITIVYPERDCNIELLRSQVLKEIERRSKKDKHHMQTVPSLEKENISLFPDETALLQINKIKNSEDESLHERFQLLDNIDVKKTEILELNRLVTNYIKRTDEKTSLLQKISFMNFYKSRTENYLLFLEFLKAWVSNPNIDEKSIKNATIKKDQLKIKLEEPYNKNPYLKRLNEEIEYLSAGINFEYDKGHKCVPEDVSAFLNDLQNAGSNKIHDFIDKISTDMKIHSTQTFNLMTFDTCMLSTSSKYPNESTLYSNCLVNFIFKTFNNVQTRHRLSHEKKANAFVENYFQLYMFFVNLGVELLKKHDYLSSMAIYMALESSAIEWVIKNRKDFPSSFQNNLSFFRSTFNPHDNYGNLRKIMEDCRADKIFHTPSTSIFTTFIHDFEKLSLVQDNRSQVKSLEIKNINDYFKEIRFNFETASKNHTPLSNIFSQIYSCNHPIEAIKPDAELIHSSMRKNS